MAGYISRILTGLVAVLSFAGIARAADLPPLADPEKTVAELAIDYRSGDGVNVDVYVSGEGPLRFLVDTGASNSGYYGSAILRRQIPRSFVRSEPVGTPDGTLNLSSYRFDEVRAGVFALDPPVMTEFPDFYSYYRRADEGLLGADYLNRHVVVFDFHNDRMVLYPPHTNLSRKLPGYFDAVPFRWNRRNHMLSVRGKSGKARLNALLDTGAMITTIQASMARSMGVSLEGARTISVGGVSGRSRQAWMVTVPSISFGGRTWENVEVAMIDVPLPRGLNMMLGIDLLGETPFAVDYGRKRLLLAKKDKMLAAREGGPGAQALAPIGSLPCALPAVAWQGYTCVTLEDQQGAD